MKTELSFKLANGIQLFHVEGNHYYTNQSLADVVGVSTSTIKRNRDIVKALDIALRLTECDDDT